MAQRYYNPFSGIRLAYPEDQRDLYRQYCQQSSRLRGDESPFPRMVDLWFAGLSVAARKKLNPDDLAGKKTSEFIYGSIFDGEDSWRIQVVMLVAITVEGVEVVTDPNRMMAIANRLAAAGVPHIVRMLEKVVMTRFGICRTLWSGCSRKMR